MHFLINLFYTCLTNLNNIINNLFIITNNNIFFIQLDDKISIIKRLTHKIQPDLIKQKYLAQTKKYYVVKLSNDNTIFEKVNKQLFFIK